MVKMSQRDMTRLRRKDLLDDYWKISQRRTGALVATAIRTRSTSMRDILVYGSVKGLSSWDDLKQLLFSDSLQEKEILDGEAFAELGRLVLLQNILEDDKFLGEKILRLATRTMPHQKLKKNCALVLIQHLISSGQPAAATEVLEEYPDIDSDYFHYLTNELRNPFTLGTDFTSREWLSEFNRMFTEHGITPIALDGGDNVPFDRLISEAPSCSSDIIGGRPLVSVVLTAFRPDEAALRTSVISILNQTWSNLELIIVNDSSGPEYDRHFSRIQELDPRIQIIHAEENRGTYAARNIGFAAAQGTFLTGQDDDDWSHPERIAHQLQYLEDNPDTVGCRVTAVRCDEFLSRVRTGYAPLGENASSLMVRREVFEASGYFLEARKAADTEYYYRILEVTGKRIGRLWAPLTVIRILPDSLSRGDFAPGWKHSSRRSFRSSYEYWHHMSSPQQLRNEPNSRPDVKIPRRFLGYKGEQRVSKLDVVLAGNWEKFGGPQKSMLEEVHALVAAGYSVGIMNLEAARFMSNKFQAPLNSTIQHLINVGYVDEVHYDDPVQIRLLILRYPPILQFFTADRSKLLVDSMVIVANQAPSELNGADIRYLVHDCHENAREAFGVEPIWSPQGPQVRKFLSHYLEAPVLSGINLSGILDLDSWWQERHWYRSITPVVGRHSRDDPMKWPENRRTLAELYRTDGSYDVRIMGGAKSPLKILNKNLCTTGWTVYKTDEIPVKSFLHSLDYYLYFQHSQAVEAFGRAILEALASGLVVILPKKFSEVFGEAALYANPEDIQNVIRNLHSDFSLYRKQLEKSYRILESKFSYKSYEVKVQELLKSNQMQETT